MQHGYVGPMANGLLKLNGKQSVQEDCLLHVIPDSDAIRGKPGAAVRTTKTGPKAIFGLNARCTWLLFMSATGLGPSLGLGLGRPRVSVHFGLGRKIACRPAWTPWYELFSKPFVRFCVREAVPVRPFRIVHLICGFLELRCCC